MALIKLYQALRYKVKGTFYIMLFTTVSEQLNIDQDAISVSGFSSGGSMAHLFHVAYSGLFMGAAVMAAGKFLSYTIMTDRF